MGDTVVFCYLALPFGFIGSPGIYGRLMQAVRFYHRSFPHPSPLWNGNNGFEADVFVDGGMFLEVEIWNRPSLSVTTWEVGDDLFFVGNAISQANLASEGTWGVQLLQLGYRVNLEGDSISLPDPKISGAFNLINAPVSAPVVKHSISIASRRYADASIIGMTRVGPGGGWRIQLIRRCSIRNRIRYGFVVQIGGDGPLFGM